MLNQTVNDLWACDLFYSTEVFPSPPRKDTENVVSSGSISRYSNSRSPNEPLILSGRSPLRNLAQSTNGRLYIANDPVIRRLNFQ
ncbi:unnamed protein product [Blepharisma stoltei]|uniref:Uncharacterized protein n=1 Tax=Blepharisma stoltei TaxID=1481888 RepID=A0AAU9JA53_9CILI|nr:unnamed protein product [Blepharisma stoltei]